MNHFSLYAWKNKTCIFNSQEYINLKSVSIQLKKARQCQSSMVKVAFFHSFHSSQFFPRLVTLNFELNFVFDISFLITHNQYLSSHSSMSTTQNQLKYQIKLSSISAPSFYQSDFDFPACSLGIRTQCWLLAPRHNQSLQTVKCFTNMFLQTVK